VRGPSTVFGHHVCGACKNEVALSAKQVAVSGNTSGPAPAGPALSIWWLIVPTLIYAFVGRDLVSTLILMVAGAGIKYAQTRPELPQVAKDFLPLLQSGLVFCFLGGNPIVVAAVAGAAAAAFVRREAVVRALGPWWQVQQQIPPLVRRVAAAALSLLIGYGFGSNAAGDEWTYTFLSIATSTIVTFLLIFTPPASMRPLGSRSSA
jgi:hypothetical protein